MKIRRGDEELSAASGNESSLRFKHLQPTDLFYYLNGSDEKVYMKLTTRHCMCMAGGRRAIYEAHPEQPVVHYANAEMDLGEAEVRDRGDRTEFTGGIEGEHRISYEAEEFGGPWRDPFESPW